MNEKMAVRCPWCNGEMEPDRSYKSIMAPGVGRTFWYFCDPCGAVSPRCDSPEAAYAAAMQRYAEKNQVLTMEEVESWGNKEALPIWLEFRCMGGTTQLVASLYGGMSADGIHLYDQGWRAHPRGGYGKRFRIWSVRPTDEERAGVPWECKNA